MFSTNQQTENYRSELLKSCLKYIKHYSLSERGTDIITPFPVPIHSLLEDINRAVIRTNEKPSFPVPKKKSEIYRNPCLIWHATCENTHTHNIRGNVSKKVCQNSITDCQKKEGGRYKICIFHNYLKQ